MGTPIFAVKPKHFCIQCKRAKFACKCSGVKEDRNWTPLLVAAAFVGFVGLCVMGEI